MAPYPKGHASGSRIASLALGSTGRRPARLPGPPTFYLSPDWGKRLSRSRVLPRAMLRRVFAIVLVLVSLRMYMSIG